ncbi:phage integrase central domain-containing protein [Altericroceibacterium spongiae]|uniref:phage integrase central domain-containing protein n=1 Tax=Altericroceibacterium spongiae TaxID=2320269 RepID=UPI002680FF95
MLPQEAAQTYYETHKDQWSNSKSDDQWTNSMTAYAFPSLGSKPVGSITAGETITAISKVWTEKSETGRRVKQRIRAVLNFGAYIPNQPTIS